jgi:hypothetical protein
MESSLRDGKLAARIGILHLTLADVRSDSRKPMAKTMAKLRAFLDAEAKRNAGGNGIKPIERAPIKIVVPRRELPKETRKSLSVRNVNRSTVSGPKRPTIG